MGISVQSSVTKQVISDYTNVVNNAVTQASNNTDFNCVSDNELRVLVGSIPGSNIGGKTFLPQQCYFELTDGSFNVSQTSGAQCTLNSTNLNSITTDLKNSIKSRTESWINMNLENYQGWLSIAISIANAESVSVSDIATDISNSISNSLYNDCEANAGAYNQGFLSYCGVYNKANINIDQSSHITAITSCVNENIVKNITSNTVITSIIEKTDQTIVSKQDGLSTIWKWIIIGIVAIILIVFLTIIIMAVSSSHSSKK